MKILKSLLRITSIGCYIASVPFILAGAGLDCVLLKLSTKKSASENTKRRNQFQNELSGRDPVDWDHLRRLYQVEGKSIQCPNCSGRGHPNNRWGITCKLCQNRGVLLPKPRYSKI